MNIRMIIGVLAIAAIRMAIAVQEIMFMQRAISAIHYHEPAFSLMIAAAIGAFFQTIVFAWLVYNLHLKVDGRLLTFGCMIWLGFRLPHFLRIISMYREFSWFRLFNDTLLIAVVPFVGTIITCMLLVVVMQWASRDQRTM